MLQSDWRSQAAKVIEVFKQSGQKYGSKDMPLWDISVPVNELDKESRKVIVLEENLNCQKLSLSQFCKWSFLRGPPKFKGLSKWTNFLRQHS